MLLDGVSQKQSSIKAEINYIKSDSSAIFDLSTTAKSANKLTEHVDTRLVEIANARLLNTPPSLNNDGFGLAKNDYVIANYFDDNLVQTELYPQIIKHLLDLTNASQCLVFDHTIRSVEDHLTRTEKRAPIHTVHNDYVASSAENRLNIELKKSGLNASDYKKFQFINTWIPLVDVVLDSPLALGDARTFHPEQSQKLPVAYPDRIGEIEAFSYDDNNRWYFYPQMTSQEQLNFKVFDSDLDSAISRTPHSAFSLPMSDQKSAVRISIEVRCIVLFD
ncbi:MULTISPECIES: CmcJ/NvfI family oxidoreductase [Shewanella]|uniref:Methyltransferase n=1 Tax=Shewanella psychromarinicola TaxID=2487742 RepID=A0A3N4ETQ2_9GAMM|nr:CmcJ/NvfI family oxidoreductase [Shewanella psychromarinicola]AZG34415.1 hypothetical protein EGC80_05380 [Shewanella psychromarinicola]MCL1082032.1 hypothetical protein [Shewanella psychromarinicola]RPA32514.1 hypothetical protein EGC77_12000 [Shewanella psychromarinicola]